MIRIVAGIVGIVLVWMLVISPVMNAYNEEQGVIDMQYKVNGQTISHHEARERIDAYNTQKVQKDIAQSEAYKDNQKTIDAADKAATAAGY
jgi:cell division protein FtsL